MKWVKISKGEDVLFHITPYPKINTFSRNGIVSYVSQNITYFLVLHVAYVTCMSHRHSLETMNKLKKGVK